MKVNADGAANFLCLLTPFLIKRRLRRLGESAETGGRPLPASTDHELPDELVDRTLYSVGLGKSTKCFLCVYTDEKLAEGSVFLDATRGPLEEVNAAQLAAAPPRSSAQQLTPFLIKRRLRRLGEAALAPRCRRDGRRCPCTGVL
jgi:hypothetical protein